MGASGPIHHMVEGGLMFKLVFIVTGLALQLGAPPKWSYKAPAFPTAEACEELRTEKGAALVTMLRDFIATNTGLKPEDIEITSECQSYEPPTNLASWARPPRALINE